MITLKILDEMSPLEAVILGTANDMGGVPAVEDAYDPKSIQHIKAGTFPREDDVSFEMETFVQVLLRYGVQVFRPVSLSACNQVFSRDIGIVIEDRFIIPRILKNRKDEIHGIQYIVDQLVGSKILRAPENARLEGGDIMPHKGKIFAGYSKQADFEKYTVSRTNEAGIEFLQKNFKEWEVIPIELKKSDTDPYTNALHLDCCFQPIGRNLAIIHPEGFKNQSDISTIEKIFGRDNLLTISKEEMYDMNSNLFSISPNVVVSERNFTRVNSFLRSKGITVEEVPYSETAKMEGLLRCSTLPLRRNYD